METQSNAPKKSKKVYAILAFFLGSLGIHNFWAGHKKRGIIELVLGLIVWITVLVLMNTEVPLRELEAMLTKIKAVSCIPLIWFFIDIFTVKKDGNGVPFK